MAQMKFNLNSFIRDSDGIVTPNNPIGVDVTGSETLTAKSFINQKDYYDIYMIYDFDLTTLPINISITSFEIQAAVCAGTTYNQGSISITTGTNETLLTKKLVNTGIYTQKVSINNISPTVQQVKDNLRIRLQSDSSGRGYYHEIELFGATVIINYEILPPQINLKLGETTLKNYSIGKQKVRQIYKGEDLYYGLNGNLRELEYIEITPTFTDTYFSPEFSVPIDLTNVQTATWEIELDATDGVVGWYYSSGFDFYMDFRQYGQAIFRYGQKSFSIPNWTKGRHRYTIDFANSRLGYDNTWYNMETVVYSGLSGANFGATVCLKNTNTEGYDAGLIGKFYRMKLSTSTQSYELIPCMYKPSDYKYAALYDLANDTIYYVTTDSTATKKRNSLRLGPIADLYDEGYEQLRFIEGTGTQYIDTGVKANSNVDMEAEIAVTNHGWHVNDTPDVGGFMGNAVCGDSGGNRRSLRIYNENNIYFYNANTGWPTVYHKLSVVMERNKYQIKGNEFFMNDVLQISTTSGTWTDATNNMELLRSGELPVKGRLYSSKVWVDNHLERDFIPAKRLSDGKLGMYDLVYHQFYTNAGTGEFLEPIPEGHQELNYIRSYGTGTGTGQYIDTDYAPKAGDKVKISIVFSPTEINSNEREMLAMYGGGENFQVGWKTGKWFGDDRYHFDGGSSPTGDVQAVSGESQIANNSSLNLFLFAQNEGGTPHWDCSTLLFRCSIWNNNTPVRDFVPCYRKSDGLKGLYDLVERKYYPCQGTGTFGGGQEVL